MAQQKTPQEYLDEILAGQKYLEDIRTGQNLPAEEPQPAKTPENLRQERREYSQSWLDRLGDAFQQHPRAGARQIAGTVADAGSKLGRLGEAIRGGVGQGLGGGQDILGIGLQRAAEQAPEPTGPSDPGRITPLSDRWGEFLEEGGTAARERGKAIQEALPGPEGGPQGYLEQVAQGVGTTAPGLLAGILTMGGTTSAKIGAMFLSSFGLEGGGLYYEALEKTGDPETAWEAAMAGGIPATLLDITSLAQLAKVFSRIDKASGGLFRRTAFQVGKAAGGEGLTEGGQSILSDIGAKYVYDEDRVIGQTALQEGLVGFGAGLVLSLMGVPFSMRGSKTSPDGAEDGGSVNRQEGSEGGIVEPTEDTPGKIPGIEPERIPGADEAEKGSTVSEPFTQAPGSQKNLTSTPDSKAGAPAPITDARVAALDRFRAAALGAIDRTEAELGEEATPEQVEQFQRMRGRVEGVALREPKSAEERLVSERFAQRGVQFGLVEGTQGTGFEGAYLEGAVLQTPQEEGAALRRFGYHEMAHALRDLHRGSWDALVAEIEQTDPEGFQAALSRATGAREAMGISLSPEAQADEQAAVYVEGIARWLDGVFQDEETFRGILENNRTLGQRIIDALVRALQSLGIPLADTRARRLQRLADAINLAAEEDPSLDYAPEPEAAARLALAAKEAFDSMLVVGADLQANEQQDENPDPRPIQRPPTAARPEVPAAPTGSAQVARPWVPETPEAPDAPTPQGPSPMQGPPKPPPPPASGVNLGSELDALREEVADLKEALDGYDVAGLKEAARRERMPEPGRMVNRPRDPWRTPKRVVRVDGMKVYLKGLKNPVQRMDLEAEKDPELKRKGIPDARDTLDLYEEKLNRLLRAENKLEKIERVARQQMGEDYVPFALTPAFWRWFGDSKVVEAPISSRDAGNGGPLVVYHGSTRYFTKHDPNAKGVVSTTFGTVETIRPFIFVSEDPAFASDYADTGEAGGNVQPLYASIRNPLYLDTASELQEDYDRLKSAGFDVVAATRHTPEEDLWTLFDGEDAVAFRSALERAGFDGATFVETSPHDGVTSRVWVALEPTQIKSALGNRGTYDPALDDIRFAVSEPTLSGFTHEQLDAKEDAWTIAAEKEFGTTDLLEEAGYIMPDGTMLDFSEKAHGGPGGSRTLDHRAVARVADDLEWGTESMWAFMEATGAVRVSFHGDGIAIDLAYPLTGRARRIIQERVDSMSWVAVDAHKMGTRLFSEEADVFSGSEVWRLVNGAEEAIEAEDRNDEPLFAVSRQVMGGPIPVRRMDTARTNIVEHLTPAERLQGVAGEKLDETLDAVQGEKLRRGKTRDKLRKLVTERWNVIIREMRGLKGALPLLDEARKIAGGWAEKNDIQTLADLYLWAKHAPFRNALIIKRNEKKVGEGVTDTGDTYPIMVSRFGHEENPGSGMRTSKAEAVVDFLEQSAYGEQFRELSAKWDQFTNDTLDEMVRYELISQQHRDALVEAFPHYVPMRGELMEEREDGSGVDKYNVLGGQVSLGRGIDVRGREFKPALGRSTLGEHPIAHGFQQAATAIVRGEKAEVGRRLLAFLREYADRLGDVVNMDPQFTKETLGKDGKVRRIFDVQAAQRPGVLGFKEGGETVWVEFKPGYEGIAQAMRGLGPEMSAWWVSQPRRITSFLSAMSTRYNPAFTPFNALRDAATAFFNASELGWGFAARVVRPDNMARALATIIAAERAQRAEVEAREPSGFTRSLGALTNPKYLALYARYKAAGGPVSILDLVSLEKQIKSIEKLSMQGDRTAAGVGKLAKGFFNLAGDVNDAVENMARFSAFVEMVERGGATDEQAALFAKELTVNFEQKGRIGPLLNAYYAFSVAGINGTHRALAALARSRRVQAMTLGMMAFAAAWEPLARVLAGTAPSGDDWWDLYPKYEKRDYIVIPHFWKQDGSRTTIPKPFVFRWFYNLGAAAGEQLDPRGTKDPVESAFNLFEGALDEFNPFGGASQPLEVLTPTLGDPLVQIATNKDWAGRQIMPDDFGAGKPLSERYWPDTNPALVEFAKFLNKATGGDEVVPGEIDRLGFNSPEIYEELIRFPLGGLGSFLERTLNVTQRAVTGEDVPSTQIPVIRRLLRESSPYWTDRRFREHTDLIDQIEAQIRAAEKRKDRGRARQLRANNRKLLSLSPQADELKRSLKRLREREKDEGVRERMEEKMTKFNRKALEAQRKDGQR